MVILSLGLRSGLWYRSFPAFVIFRGLTLVRFHQLLYSTFLFD